MLIEINGIFFIIPYINFLNPSNCLLLNYNSFKHLNFKFPKQIKQIDIKIK